MRKLKNTHEDTDLEKQPIELKLLPKKLGITVHRCIDSKMSRIEN